MADLDPIYRFFMAQGMSGNDIENLTLREVENMINDSPTYSFENDGIRLGPIYQHLMYEGMNGDQIENLTLMETTQLLNKSAPNDRAFRTGWSVVKSPCAIEKGGKICPTCGLDDDTLSITGCPMKQGM
tara:strand:- start:1880 stop:2266 length:387 start_codon:yes stop_codon:yes gene_type:complete